MTRAPIGSASRSGLAKGLLLLMMAGSAAIAARATFAANSRSLKPASPAMTRNTGGPGEAGATIDTGSYCPIPARDTKWRGANVPDSGSLLLSGQSTLPDTQRFCDGSAGKTAAPRKKPLP
jgi:hypothetical protein